MPGGCYKRSFWSTKSSVSLAKCGHIVFTLAVLSLSTAENGTCVADYDTSNGDDCPTGWKKMTVNGLELCRPPDDNVGCHSAHFPVNKSWV